MMHLLDIQGDSFVLYFLSTLTINERNLEISISQWMELLDLGLEKMSRYWDDSCCISLRQKTIVLFFRNVTIDPMAQGEGFEI